MTLNQLSSALYWMARRTRDVQAARTGKLPQRLARRAGYRIGIRAANAIIRGAK